MDLNQNKKTKSSYSWPIIILFLIIFFPVGIYLIYKRINSDKTNIINNSITIKNISIVLLVFALIYFFMGITGGLTNEDGSTSSFSDSLLMIFIFGGSGTYLLLLSMKMKKTGQIYKKYIQAVINHGTYSIYDLSSIAALPYESVKKDLYNMLEIGFFKGAYIDENNNEIVLPTLGSAQNILKKDAKVVKCGSCGANNTVFIGNLNECTYCGSPLE